jgi:plastocyanin
MSGHLKRSNVPRFPLVRYVERPAVLLIMLSILGALAGGMFLEGVSATGEVNATTITITSSGFSPKHLEISAGETVNWQNTTNGRWVIQFGKPHTVYLPLVRKARAGLASASPETRVTDAPVEEPFRFTVEPNSTATLLFEFPGAYEYFSVRRPHLQGSITVAPSTDWCQRRSWGLTCREESKGVTIDIPHQDGHEEIVVNSLDVVPLSERRSTAYDAFVPFRPVINFEVRDAISSELLGTSTNPFSPPITITVDYRPGDLTRARANAGSDGILMLGYWLVNADEFRDGPWTPFTKEENGYISPTGTTGGSVSVVVDEWSTSQIAWGTPHPITCQRNETQNRLDCTARHGDVIIRVPDQAGLHGLEVVSLPMKPLEQLQSPEPDFYPQRPIINFEVRDRNGRVIEQFSPALRLEVRYTSLDWEMASGDPQLAYWPVYASGSEGPWIPFQEKHQYVRRGTSSGGWGFASPDEWGDPMISWGLR